MKGYQFKLANTCNMCGSEVSSHKFLGRRLNGSQGKNPSKKIGITTSILKCDTCGLIYPNPLPIPIDIQDHYGIPPESYWKESNFNFELNFFSPVIDRVKSIRPLERGSKILDIGVGLGQAMKSMESLGFDVHGIEPSVPFYERAINKMGVSPDKLSLKTVEEAEYPDDFFDFITFGAVLEHLYDPSEAISKAIKWLKPGGIIHIEVPSSEWLTHKIFNFYYKIRGLDFVANLSPMHEPYHLYEFNLKSFRIHGEKNGYRVARYDFYVCETFLPKKLDFIIKPYMRKKDKGMQLCVYLQKN
jgi:2-polyprenyl-3-methyl-5-hydroxy-6-metoxy-1,4-benzoquinol methylase